MTADSFKRAAGATLHLLAVFALFSAFALAWTAAPAFAQSPAPTAERRVALVIGNARYERLPLANPLNDAADLSAALRRLGFEVLERSNRNPDQMHRDLADFQDKLGPGAVGLYYFAGHGVQAGRGLNYLLPVGVDYRRERDAELYGLEAGVVLRRMEEAGTALSLVILDACRDSPLPPEGRSSGSRGLGRMDAPSGSLVAFATAPGSTADENRGARNGLYTQHLLAAIETPGLRVEDVFKRVRSAVERATNRRQSPEEVNKLTTDFYFINPAVPRPVAATPLPPPLTAPLSGGGLSLADLEREQATRAQWANWQGRMQADFNRAAEFSGSADLQVQAWQRFLQAWGQDNPTSAQDEQLRSQAQDRLAQAQRAVQLASVVPEPVRPAPAVAAQRVYVVGTDAAYAPFESQNERGQIVGFDIDLVQAIAVKAGFNVRFVNTPWERVFNALGQGERDMLVSAITITDERRATMSFNAPYLDASQVIVLRNSSAVSRFSDLRRLRVGVQTGTTGDEAVTALLGKTNQNIRRIESTPLALKELEAGSLDAVVGDNGVVAHYIANNPKGMLKAVADPHFVPEQYGIVVKKGDNELLRKINQGLAGVRSDGTYQRLLAKYFGVGFERTQSGAGGR